MKKEKFLWDIVGAVLLLLYSSFLLLSPMFGIQEIKLFVAIFFAIYGSVHFIESITFWQAKEYSHLLLGVLGTVGFWTVYLSDIINTTKHFALFLVAFTLFGSLIKILKADYFHDRKNIFWRVEISFLLLFLLSTVLVCFNLAYESSILLLILGFYFFLIGMIELFEAILLNLMKGTLK